MLDKKGVQYMNPFSKKKKEEKEEIHAFVQIDGGKADPEIQNFKINREIRDVIGWYEDLWNKYEDGVEIGRLYLQRAPETIS